MHLTSFSPNKLWNYSQITVQIPIFFCMRCHLKQFQPTTFKDNMKLDSLGGMFDIN